MDNSQHAPKPLTACPHCAGRNGYVTRIRFAADRMYSWDRACIDTDNYTVTSETAPRCADCGKPVGAVLAAATGSTQPKGGS